MIIVADANGSLDVVAEAKGSSLLVLDANGSIIAFVDEDANGSSIDVLVLGEALLNDEAVVAAKRLSPVVTDAFPLDVAANGSLDVNGSLDAKGSPDSGLSFEASLVVNTL